MPQMPAPGFPMGMPPQPMPGAFPQPQMPVMQPPMPVAQPPQPVMPPQAAPAPVAPPVAPEQPAVTPRVILPLERRTAPNAAGQVPEEADLDFMTELPDIL